MEKRKKKKEDVELKEVHKVWGPAEAEVIKSLLDSHGIPCILRGQVVHSVFPYSTNGLGEIKILVSERDYPSAKELLDKKQT